jgi:hypothetical protein
MQVLHVAPVLPILALTGVAGRAAGGLAVGVAVALVPGLRTLAPAAIQSKAKQSKAHAVCVCVCEHVVCVRVCVLVCVRASCGGRRERSACGVCVG